MNTERFLLCAQLRAEPGGWYALGWGDCPAVVEASAAPYLDGGEYCEQTAVIARTRWSAPWSTDAPPAWAQWPAVVMMDRTEPRWAVPLFIDMRSPDCGELLAVAGDDAAPPPVCFS